MLPQVEPLKELLHGVERGILHEWHQYLWTLPTIRHTLFWILAAHGQLDQERQSESSRNMRCIMALRQSFAVVKILSCLPTLRRRPVGRAVLSIFPTTPPCSTRVDVLETGNVPIFFFHPHMKHLGMTIELDPKKRQNYMSGFWLVLLSSWILYAGTYCSGLEESCVPAKIEWAVSSPKKTCNLCSEQKSACPAPARELDEDDDGKPLVRPNRSIVSEDEDDEPLVRPSSRTELIFC